MSSVILIILIGAFLAYANGANDNFKGVATLYGSGTTNYRTALIWATVTTLLGSLAALFLAKALIATFSGKGLVPDSVLLNSNFPLSVALAAGSTVLLATRYGLPISTTHALTGALIGSGLFASSQGVNLSRLGTAFFLPLLISPMIAIGATLILYPILRRARKWSGIKRENCLCIGNEIVQVVPFGLSSEAAVAQFQLTSPIKTGTEISCREQYTGSFFGISAAQVLDSLHFLSSGIVSFARGLNDTPKITAILIAVGAINPKLALLTVAVTMAIGGINHSKKIAETMSHRVTTLNHGQGFTANFLTGLIVIGASQLGSPVSTTHVSCGSLFGIGAITGNANWKTIGGILIAWLTTLPIAAILGATIYFGLERVIG